MSCKRFEERIPEYVAGNMSEDEKRAMADHLSGCEGCRLQSEQMQAALEALDTLPEEEPSPVLRSRFYAMLESERRREAEKVHWSERLERWLSGIWPRRPVIQFGFSVALLVVGLFLGGRFQVGIHRNGEMAQLRQEVTDMRQMVSLSLMSQASSSERLRGISYTAGIDQPSESLLNNLLTTLNSDPSVNVRLAAVDALLLFSDRPGVRDALVASLNKQSSPLVQISLIDLLVQIQEKKSLEALRNLIQSHDVDQTVKQYAEKRMEDLT